VPHSSPRFHAPVLLSLAVVAGTLLVACEQDPTSPDRETRSVASLSAGTWTTKAPMPIATWQLAAGVVMNAEGRTILYAIGGPTVDRTGLIKAYDPVSDSWEPRQLAPIPGGMRERTNGVGVINGKLFISGGDAIGRAVEGRRLLVYDPAENSWRRKTNLPITSWGGVTGVIRGKLYVLTGGCGSCPGEPYTRRLYVFNPRKHVWTRLADCPNQHVLGAGGVIKSKFYVAGGQELQPEGPIVFSNKLDAYDPATNTWTTLASMPTARYHAAAAVLRHRLHIIGGTNDSDLFSQVEAYDPLTNRWSTKASMPTARMGLAAAVVRDRAGVSHILAIGGGDNTVGVLATTEAYRP
jgi:N-acetylneuraminic acid mutarotase